MSRLSCLAPCCWRRGLPRQEAIASSASIETSLVEIEKVEPLDSVSPSRAGFRCVCVCMYVGNYMIHTHTHMNVCMHVCIKRYTCKYMGACISTPLSFTHTHTHTHTHAHRRLMQASRIKITTVVKASDAAGASQVSQDVFSYYRMCSLTVGLRCRSRVVGITGSH